MRIPPDKRKALWGYSIALLVILLTTTLALMIRPFLISLGSPLFLIGVILSAWLGGLGPGIFAALCSFLAINILFIHPLNTFSYTPLSLLWLFVALIVTGLVGAQRQATAQLKETNEQLNKLNLSLYETNGRLNALIKASPLAVMILNPQGMVQLWSPAAERLTGWRSEEALGHSPPFVPVEKIAEFLSNLQAALETESSTEFETQRQKKDGTLIDVTIWAAPMLDRHNQVRGVIAVMAEITQRKRAAARQRFLADASTLLASSLRYEATLTSLTRLVVTTVADSCVIVLRQEDERSQVFLAHCDPTKEVLIHEFLQRHPLVLNQTPGGMFHVLHAGESIIIPEVTSDTLDTWGHLPDLHSLLQVLDPRAVIIVPLVIRHELLGAVLLATSESQRGYTPEDQAMANDLAYRIAVAIDNALLYQEAQAAVEIRDLFLSIASHELKTPVAALQGYADLLQRRVRRDGALDKRSQRAIGSIYDQAVRLHKKIDALLDLSRIQAGRITLSLAPLDLNMLVSQIVSERRPMLEQHTLVVEAPETPVMVVGDELRLEQVVQNLLDNAIKYSPQGGLVQITLERQEQMVCLAISDQGIGIPLADQPRLFARFYRASNTNSQSISGMGIGLYLVREIVTLHAGTIDLSSREGEGSTFFLSLPAATESSPADQQAPQMAL